MLQDSNELLDPKDIDTDNDNTDAESETEDSEDGYEILPSNGPGLTGDDGDQVIDYEEDDLETDESTDEDDDEEDDL